MTEKPSEQMEKPVKPLTLMSALQAIIASIQELRKREEVRTSKFVYRAVEHLVWSFFDSKTEDFAMEYIGTTLQITINTISSSVQRKFCCEYIHNYVKSFEERYQKITNDRTRTIFTASELRRLKPRIDKLVELARGADEGWLQNIRRRKFHPVGSNECSKDPEVIKQFKLAFLHVFAIGLKQDFSLNDFHTLGGLFYEQILINSQPEFYGKTCEYIGLEGYPHPEIDPNAILQVNPIIRSFDPDVIHLFIEHNPEAKNNLTWTKNYYIVEFIYELMITTMNINQVVKIHGPERVENQDVFQYAIAETGLILCLKWETLDLVSKWFYVARRIADEYCFGATMEDDIQYVLILPNDNNMVDIQAINRLITNQMLELIDM